MNSSRRNGPDILRIVVFGFVALWSIAMATYPGWNAFDSESVGHDFFLNFICDLLTATTPDGRSNTVASVAMNAGVIVLVGGGLLPLWWHVSVHNPWRLLSRTLGCVAALLVLVICVEQSFAVSLSHNKVTLLAGAAGLLPTFLVAVADWYEPETTHARRLFLVGVIVGALVNLISYSLVQLGSPLTVIVPASQKVSLVCLVIWLFLKPIKAGSPEIVKGESV